MKILLISPPSLIHKRYVYRKTPFLSMGLGYLAALLKKRYDVGVVDMFMEGYERRERYDKDFIRIGLSMDALKETIKRFTPEAVGVSIPFSSQYKMGFDAARAVKEVDKDIPVIAGGQHPSIFYADCLKTGFIDFVVIGEGEETLMELITALENKKNDFGKINGIAFKRDGAAVRTGLRPYIKDLDTLPYPAWELFPVKRYFSFLKRRRLKIITSRGCPFGCNFCAVHCLMGNLFRPRSVRSVCDEIEVLIKRYKIEELNIDDDNVTCDRRRAMELFDEMIRRNFKIDWYAGNGIRPDTIDEVMAEKIAASGCKALLLSADSGSQRVLDTIIHKNMRLSDYERSLVLFKKAGIYVKSNIIIGFPGETMDDIKKSIDYAFRLRELGADEIEIPIATPYPGTELYRIAKEKRYLTSADFTNFVTELGNIKTEEFTPEELIKLRDDTYRRVNPQFRLFTLKHFLTAARHPKYALKMLAAYLRDRSLSPLRGERVGEE